MLSSSEVSKSSSEVRVSSHEGSVPQDLGNAPQDVEKNSLFYCKAFIKVDFFVFKAKKGNLHQEEGYLHMK